MNIGYVTSTMIAGILMLSLIALNLRVSRDSAEKTLYGMARTQSDLLVEMFTEDVRAMGYGMAGAFPILEANTQSIRFQITYEGDSDPTVIRWYFAADSSVSWGNPDVRPLYRFINGQPDEIGTGVTRFNLEYLDQARNLIDPSTHMSDIRQIRLELLVESTERFEADRIIGAYWTGEFTPYHLAIR